MDQWNEIYKKEGTNYQYYNIIEPHQDMPKVAEFLKSTGAKRVLDLGCGAGRNLIYLAQQGFDTYGMDIAPEGLKIIRENLAKNKLQADLKEGNVFAPLPYPDEFFDGVISVQVLQHGTEQQILAATKEIDRILKNHGIIFITLSGRISKGKVRLILVKTAKKIAPNTYVPTQGNEIGLTHFIYSKQMIKHHYRNFKISTMWKDDKDYYCFLAVKR
jgi:SAM-dependent methyltransferase